MQNIESPLTGAPEAPVKPLGKVTEGHSSPLTTNYNVVRRNGKLTGFDKNKIAIAMTKAFLAVEGGQAAASSRVHETVEKLTDLVVDTLTRRQPDGGTFHIEDIQDQVELAMMRNGDQKIARAYVLYREERSNARAMERIEQPDVSDMQTNGSSVTFTHAGDHQAEADLLRSMIEAGFSVLAFGSQQQTLEDVFMHVTQGLVQ